MFALAVSLVAPAVAAGAYTWGVGGASGFEGALTDAYVVPVTGVDVVRLARRIVWTLSPSPLFDPRTAVRLPNGHTLVCDGNAQTVTEYTSGGSRVWTFGTSDDPRLSRPFSAERLANGNTLICDRTSFRVIEVSPSKRLVWQYGTGTAGTGAGQLADPFSARRLANGNTLICDNKEGYRVIEVRSSDYAPSKPNLGYTASSIVWRFGTGVSGTGPGQVASPRQAERLSNGNTLIADEWGERVIEVRPNGQVVWSFGVPGQKGSDERHLNAPCAATRLADGRTLVVDKDNQRLLWVNRDGTVDSSYGAGPTTPSGGQLGEARTAQVTPAGSVLIADNGAHRLLEIGYASGGTYETDELDLRMPGTKKWLTSLTVAADKPGATSLAVTYSLNGGSWKTLGSGSPMEFPNPTSCTFVRLRFRLSTSNADRSPTLKSAVIAYDITAPPLKPPTNGGTTSPTTPSTSGGGSQNSSPKRYTWGWGRTDGGGTGGTDGGTATGGTGASAGTPSIGDLSLSGTDVSSAAARTGWLLKEVAPGPAEGGSGSSGGSGGSDGSGGSGPGAVSNETADVVTKQTGRIYGIVTMLTLGLAYLAGALSGTLSNAARGIARVRPSTSGLEV
jgi:hypothetical protein